MRTIIQSLDMKDEQKFLEKRLRDEISMSVHIDGTLRVEVSPSIENEQLRLTANLKCGNNSIYHTGYTVKIDGEYENKDINEWVREHTQAYTNGIKTAFRTNCLYPDYITCLESVFYKMQNMEEPVMTWVKPSDIVEGQCQ